MNYLKLIALGILVIVIGLALLMGVCYLYNLIPEDIRMWSWTIVILLFIAYWVGRISRSVYKFFKHEL